MECIFLVIAALAVLGAPWNGWRTPRTLDQLEEMLEEAEIIKSIRSMRLGSRELLSVLEGVQSGTVIFSQKAQKAGGPSSDGSREPEMAGNAAGASGHPIETAEDAAEDFSDGQGLPQGTGLEREALEDE